MELIILGQLHCPDCQEVRRHIIYFPDNNFNTPKIRVQLICLNECCNNKRKKTFSRALVWNLLDKYRGGCYEH